MGTTIIMLIVIACLAIVAVERHVKTKQLKVYLQTANNTTHEANMALIDAGKKLDEEKLYSGKLRTRLHEVEENVGTLLRTRK